MIYLILIVLIFTCIANYYLGGKSSVYPPFVLCCLWLLILSLYALEPIEIIKLVDETLWIIFLGVFSFSVGGLLGTEVSKNILITNDGIAVGKWGVIFGIGYCIFVFPIFFVDILAASGGVLDLSEINRAMTLAGLENTNIFSNQLASTAGFISMSVALVAMSSNVSKCTKIWALLLAILYAVLLSGRTYLLALFVGVLFVQIINSKKTVNILPVVKKLLWMGPVFVIALVMYKFVTYDVSEELYGQSLFGLAFDYFFAYLLGPTAAFDLVVQSEKSGTVINHSLQFFYWILNSFFGFDYMVPDHIDEFVYVPFPVNVATAFKFYYVDFGITGVAIAFFIFGFLHSYAYNKSLRSQQFWVYVCALMFYPLVFSFFDDVYYNVRGALRDISVYIVLFFITKISYLFMYDKK